MHSMLTLTHTHVHAHKRTHIHVHAHSHTHKLAHILTRNCTRLRSHAHAFVTVFCFYLKHFLLLHLRVIYLRWEWAKANFNYGT